MKVMNDEVIGRIWKPILQNIKKVRECPYTPDEVKKAQFLKIRQELIKFFSDEFSTTTKKWTQKEIDTQLNSQTYFKELQEAGIDPNGLFPQAYPDIDFVHQDLDNWMQNRAS